MKSYFVGPVHFLFSLLHAKHVVPLTKLFIHSNKEINLLPTINPHCAYNPSEHALTQTPFCRNLSAAQLESGELRGGMVTAIFETVKPSSAASLEIRLFTLEIAETMLLKDETDACVYAA